jgi:hypothetical protein
VRKGSAGSGMTRGDRRRNARRERLRGLLPRDGAVIGIDLAEDKQALAVVDHDVRLLARKTVRVKAFRLGEALDWAVGQARAKGFAHVTVACEPTGPRWLQVQRLCAERGLPLVGVIRRGDTGTDVEELADARIGGEEPDRAAQEGTVGAHPEAQPRRHREHPLGRLPVSGEIVLAAQPVVVNAGGMRRAGVQAGQAALFRGPPAAWPAVCLSHDNWPITRRRPAATAVTASTNRFAHERSDAPDRRSTWPDPTIQSVATVTIEPDGAEASIMTIEHELLPSALVRRHAHGWTATSAQLGSRLRSTESRSPDPGSRPRTRTAPH